MWVLGPEERPVVKVQHIGEKPSTEPTQDSPGGQTEGRSWWGYRETAWKNDWGYGALANTKRRLGELKCKD